MMYELIFFQLVASVSSFLEINPACANITCQNGGSCLYIEEANNTVCACNNDLNGEFCEGINLHNLL